MVKFDRQGHWEKIHQLNEFSTVSWYQQVPQTSLDFLKKFNINKSAKIIDIGGGGSLFVDHLVKLGYQHLTVLDISNSAIQKAKTRLGQHAKEVNWIVRDITEFVAKEKYDFWHDRDLSFLDQ